MCRFVRWSEIEFISDMGRGKRKRVKTDRYKPVDTEKKTGKEEKLEGDFDEDIREIMKILDGENDDEDNVSRLDALMKKVEGRVVGEYNHQME